MSFLEADKLTFSYPDDIPALSGVSFSVSEGEFITLCGLSGCGKSTLLRLLKPGLFPVGKLTGSVFFDGSPLSPEPDITTASGIAFVMQDPEAQTVTDKVWHELAFSCESVGMPQGEIRRRVAEMAEYFGLSRLFERNTATLSGGQRQLLCLASAAALHPKLLLLDEPTSQLDPISSQGFIDAVRRLNRDHGVTVITAEHRLEELFPISDRVFIMDGGRLIADCPPDMAAEALPINHPMFAALPTAQRVFSLAGGKGAAPITIREGRSSAVCTEYLRRLPDGGIPPEKRTDTVITVKDVCAGYKDSPGVLNGASLKLFRGQVFAVLGGSGSGKSTLLKITAGLIKPSGGKVIRQKGIETGYLPQNPCQLFTADRAEEEASPEMLTLFGLDGIKDRNPYDLSGGEQQRLALAKVLTAKPDVLLLDEPASGMDIKSRTELAKLIRKLASEGTAVIMATHDTVLAAMCADTCGLLSGGEILNEAPPAEFFGTNYYYTTPAAKLCRGIKDNTVIIMPD